MVEGTPVLRPEWPAPCSVHALVTTRQGGVSVGPYESFNLGSQSGDDPMAVLANRKRLRALFKLPGPPFWLQQVHGCRVVRVPCPGEPIADAAWTDRPKVVCAVLTADCLPVLLCDRGGQVVCAVHAGWRGLAGGVLEAAIEALPVPSAEILAWLGPAIGPRAFEVGPAVRSLFIRRQPEADLAFIPSSRRQGAYLADLYELARLCLASTGVVDVYGGGLCTYHASEEYYSYRREGQTGRMVSLIWRD